MNKNNCSILIHTRNEQANILDCISSASLLSPSIIVVDMASKDDTVKLAKSQGAKIYHYPASGYVEPARNFGISKVETPWVLVLDADERIGPDLVKKLDEIIDQDLADIVRIPRKNIILGKWIEHGYWWPDHQIRLFKKNAVKWSPVIHSVPKLNSERVMTLPSLAKYSILHAHNQTVSDIITKFNHYTDYQPYPKLGYHDIYTRIIEYPSLEFNRIYLEKEAYKDGIEGYLIAKYMEFYELTKLAKSWEKSKFRDPKLFAVYADQIISDYGRKSELARFQQSKLYRIWSWYNKLKKYLYA